MKANHSAERSTPKATALPSREEILAFIATERHATGHGKVAKRDIAKAFNIKGAAKIELKRMLRELEDDGALERRGKAIRPAGVLPDMVVADIVGRDRDGECVARPSDWDAAEHGEAPRILVHQRKDKRSSLPAPGVGDRVLLRVETARSGEDGQAAYTGRVVKALGKPKPRLFGVIRFDSRGRASLMPIDKRNSSADYVVPEAALGEAQDGELVAAEPIGRARGLGPQPVRVMERLGSTRSEKAVSTIAILTHGIPYVFGADVLAEAAAVRPATLTTGREDWRALPLVTIDPPDAKDHDDAVHAQPDPDPANAGGFVVTVAIADVACLIRPESALDREALERGNSVYFPDRVVPMLPERISTDLGSLRPHEDRPALAVRLVLGADGAKRRHSFHRVMMRSAGKLAYAQAQAAIDGKPDETTGPLLDAVLKPLWQAYRLASRGREDRAPLDLDLPERKIVLKPDGTVERVVVPQRLDAHRLIEEFMILANVAAAETLEARRQRLVYRVHDEPSLTKLHALQEFLQSIGIKFARGQVMRPALFNSVLAKAKGSEHEHLINEVVLRSQAQAEYAVENYGHFGLNLARYAHFTSPIRRYADLIVHRALIRALGFGDDGLPDFDGKVLGEMAARISAAERRAMAAERETVDRLVAGFLIDRVGASFEGRISGVTRSGLFLRLTETGADGFVPASTLGDEYFAYQESAHALVGTRSRTSYRLGDLVTARLVEAAPLAGALRFEIVGSGGGAGGRQRARPRGGKAAGAERMAALRRSRRHKS
ncbi:MAG TPA: ribonuclease R [Lichenihabitans sp.]|jgi:ribonuclease R|nr:ribonuclease R [Lichenihabitans sp.]